MKKLDFVEELIWRREPSWKIRWYIENYFIRTP